jgi:hypothetical protein
MAAWTISKFSACGKGQQKHVKAIFTDNGPDRRQVAIGS